MMFENLGTFFSPLILGKEVASSTFPSLELLSFSPTSKFSTVGTQDMKNELQEKSPRCVEELVKNFYFR